jgi:hypothetical protein
MVECASRSPLLRATIVTLLVTLIGACGGGGSGGVAAPTQLVSITVTPGSAHITAGLSQQLQATGNYSDSSTIDLTDTVVWSTASPTTATVNATSGLVTGVGVGSTAITAKLNSVSGVTTVTITPPTQGWALAGDLITPRLSGFTATLLPDGTVLVAGGVGPAIVGTGSLNNAEIFNPVTGQWTATGSMTAARQSHTATLLPDGTVLVAGGAYCDGCDAATLLTSAEIYHPATGVWTATGSMTAAVPGQVATLLSTGQVLLAGDGTTSDQLFDPATATWSAVPGNAIQAATATLLADGTVLVLGQPTSAVVPFPAAEIYSPAAASWSAGVAPDTASSTVTPLPDGTLLSTGGSVLGYRISQIVDQANIYTPSTASWAPAPQGMIYSRTGHSATLLPNGTVLIAGGLGCAGAFCQTNGIGVTPLASAELYDPAAGTWTATGSMTESRLGHTATLLANGTVLVVGGASTLGASGYVVSAEIYYP